MKNPIEEFFELIERKRSIVSKPDYVKELIGIMNSHNLNSIDDEPYGDFSDKENEIRGNLSYFYDYLIDLGGVEHFFEGPFEEKYIVFSYMSQVYFIDTIIGQGAVSILARASECRDGMDMTPSVVFPEEELVQYIIINKDLGMSPGKIAAQAGHVCTICAVKLGNTSAFKIWYNGSQKKIVLGAHQKDMEKLEADGYFSVRDLGLTEIPQNSLTAISLGIMTKEKAKTIVKRLQLLH